MDLRRAKLRLLIAEHDGPAALAKKLGYANGTFLVQMGGPNPTREVSERTARAIEMRLGLPMGWMDRAEDHTPTSGPPGPPVASSPSSTGEFENVIGAVLKIVREEELDRKLTPEAMGQLVELLLDRCRLAGKVEDEHIRKVVRFIGSLL